MSDSRLINDQQIRDFVKSNPDYYVREFERINNSTRFVFSFNWAAFFLGTLWFGIRNIWNKGKKKGRKGRKIIKKHYRESRNWKTS